MLKFHSGYARHANLAWKSCWPRPTRAFIPSVPSRRAGCCARPSFRQDGVPHTLLLLADVSLPLQEEEQIAWKRLIRVLGHELSNSLAPIKSIAGSLLARVDNMEGDEDTLRDFRRGLGVVESRADSLHRFVQSYRLLAQLPPPQLKPVSAGPAAGARGASGAAAAGPT